MTYNPILLGPVSATLLLFALSYPITGYQAVSAGQQRDRERELPYTISLGWGA